MRIASVLHDASPERDGAPLAPTIAIERDGALYGVAALAEGLDARRGAADARYAIVSEQADFCRAVLALGGEALREMDERVRSGERPSSSRILPGTFTWLPPCDTERAAFVACTRDAGAHARDAGTPSFRVGSARAFLGHEATVPVLVDEAEASVEAAVAAVLGDDLFRATASEAHEAILGFTLLLDWKGGCGAQLGPVLVTRDEAGPIARLRAQVRVDGVALAACEVGDEPFTAAEAIAWISHHVPLRAGDVIAASHVRAFADSSARPRIAYGTRVELVVERLGRLAGKAARGPEMRAWRRSSRQS